MSATKRRKTVTVDVGGVHVGSDRPIVVQSMTNTDTADVAGTVAQVRALHEAGSELVRVTVNNDEAARAVPEIVRRGQTCPSSATSTTTGTSSSRSIRTCARALAKYRINPGNVGGKRHDENFRTIIEVARRARQARAHRRELGLPRPAPPHRDDGRERDASRAPLDARDVMHRSHGGERDPLGRAGRADRARATTASSSPRRSRACRISSTCTGELAPRCDYPLHLGLTEAGHGHEGHRGQHGGALHPPAGGHRRHHSRVAHAAARRRPHRGGAGRPADPPVAGAAQLPAPGDGLPGLRPHDVHVLPGDGGGDPDLPARADAGVEDAATRVSRS